MSEAGNQGETDGMSETPPSKASQPLPRGLVVRIAAVAIALLGIGVVALDVFQIRRPAVPEQASLTPMDPVDPATEASAAAPATAPPEANAGVPEIATSGAGEPPPGASSASEVSTPAASDAAGSSHPAPQPREAAADAPAPAGERAQAGAAVPGGAVAAAPERPASEKQPSLTVAASASRSTSPSDAAAAPHPSAAKPVRGPHLQAGVFVQPANAQALKDSLEAQGLPVYIESRVHVGPFKTRKEAERMREKLKEMGMTTVLVPQ
jgi:DedD protein